MKDHRTWTYQKSNDSGQFAVVYRECDGRKEYAVYEKIETNGPVDFASVFSTLEDAKNSLDAKAKLISITG